MDPCFYDTIEVNGDTGSLTACRLVNCSRALYLFLVYCKQECSVDCRVGLVSTNVARIWLKPHASVTRRLSYKVLDVRTQIYLTALH